MDLTQHLPVVLASALESIPPTVTFSRDLIQWFAVDKRIPDGPTALLHGIVRLDPKLQQHNRGENGESDESPPLAFQYAVWLLGRARLYGVEHALREYEELRTASHRGYHAVIVLRQLTVSRPQNMGRGVELISWDDVPFTEAKEEFTWHRHALATGVNGHAALIVHWQQHNLPFGTKEYIADEGKQDRDAVPALFDVLAAMSFGTDIAVVPVALYTQQDQDLPYPLGWSPFHSRDPNGSATWTDAYTAATRAIVQELGRLSKEFRRSVLSVSRHLATAVRADGDPAEACSQLGIALETSFLTDEETSELQYRLGVRAARFVGDSSLSDRVRVRRTVKDFYELRSKAVHRGRLTERQMRGNTHAVTIKETAEIVRKAAKRAITAGQFPLWADFDLADSSIDSATVVPSEADNLREDVAPEEPLTEQNLTSSAELGPGA